ncbi:MAG TPA: hypothetical protein VF178_11045 [Gemmatimonadaceae bacterium]
MITYRRLAEIAALAVGIALVSVEAGAQDWRADHRAPPGRAVRVEHGRARPCPPGHARKGWCTPRTVRRNAPDWCWDRNHNGRCDRVDGRVVRRNDRIIRDRRYDGRVTRRDDRRSPFDVMVERVLEVQRGGR